MVKKLAQSEMLMEFQEEFLNAETPEEKIGVALLLAPEAKRGEYRKRFEEKLKKSRNNQ